MNTARPRLFLGPHESFVTRPYALLRHSFQSIRCEQRPGLSARALRAGGRAYAQAGAIITTIHA